MRLGSPMAGFSSEADLCEVCGRAAKPVTTEPGSKRLEVALWLLFLLPGALYRLWRSYSAKTRCRVCGGAVVSLQAATRVRLVRLSLAEPAVSVELTAWSYEHASGRLVSAANGTTEPCSFVASCTPVGLDIELVTEATSRQAWLPYGKSKFDYRGVRYDWTTVRTRRSLLGLFLTFLLGDHAVFLVYVRCGGDTVAAELSASCVDTLLRGSLPGQWTDEAALLKDRFRSRLIARVFGGTPLAFVTALVAGVAAFGLGKLCSSLRDEALNKLAVAAEGLVFVLVLWRIWRGSASRPKPQKGAS